MKSNGKMQSRLISYHKTWASWGGLALFYLKLSH